MSGKTLVYRLVGKDDLTPVINKAGKEAEKTGGVMSGAFSKAGVPILAVGTLIGGFLMKSIEDARGEGFGKLKVAVDNTGESWDKLLPKIHGVGDSMAKLGFTQADTNKSLTSLVTITGSSSVAMKSLGTAADLARYKNISLAQASLSLGKASVGSTKALKDLGISSTDLPKHFATTGTAASRMGIIMDLLNKKIGGQASAYATTFGGKLAVLKAKMENVSATIGAALLPVISLLLGAIVSKVLPALQAFSAWLENKGIPKLKELATKVMPFVNQAFAYFFTGVSTILKLLAGLPAPVKIAGLAIIALGVAMRLAAAANPWILLAVAIIVVVGVITKNWKSIVAVFDSVARAISTGWNATFNAVSRVVKGVFNWLKSNWPYIVGILTGPVGIAAAIIYKHFGTIKNTAISVLNFIKGLAQTTWNAIGNFFKSMWTAILRPAIQTMWNVISSVFGFIINGAAKAFGWIPGIGGKLKGAANAFNTFRNNVNSAINGVKGKTITVGVAMSSATNPFGGNGITGRAATGRHIRGPGTSTSDTAGLYALSDGEYVVRASSVKKYGLSFMHALNAGHIGRRAGGGEISVKPQTPSAGSINAGILAGVTRYVKNNFFGGGNLAGVLALARSFVGRVPYVWGGASPSGWDCSGMVSWIYNKLGLYRGRTTAAGFQSWVTPTGPVPGGLAFYGRPAHHVGFVLDGSHLLSALGRQWGTTISSLNLGDNSGYGVPPGSGGGGGNPGKAGGIKELAFSLLRQHGWGNQWNSFNALENAEAGWSLTARNPSSGAYGMAQFINGPSEYYQYGGNPFTALGQLTGMMNYIAGRYGSPNAAWSQYYHHPGGIGWYNQGGPVTSFDTGTGILRPGYSIAHNGTGRNEFLSTRGGGGATYVINVHSSPLARPADIGREVVGAIREFERGAGKGWRS